MKTSQFIFICGILLAAFTLFGTFYCPQYFDPVITFFAVAKALLFFSASYIMADWEKKNNKKK